MLISYRKTAIGKAPSAGTASSIVSSASESGGGRGCALTVITGSHDAGMVGHLGELAQHRGIFFILSLKYFALGSLPPIP